MLRRLDVSIFSATAYRRPFFHSSFSMAIRHFQKRRITPLTIYCQYKFLASANPTCDFVHATFFIPADCLPFFHLSIVNRQSSIVNRQSSLISCHCHCHCLPFFLKPYRIIKGHIQRSYRSFLIQMKIQEGLVSHIKNLIFPMNAKGVVVPMFQCTFMAAVVMET